LKGESFLDEPVERLTVHTISRRQALRLIGGFAISCGALASIPGAAAWAQVPIDPAAQPDSIQGPAIATKEQAQRWLSMNKALDVTYGWIDLAWSWGEAVGIRPDLMLAQEMFETGWGRYQGIVKPEQHNVAGIKVGTPSGSNRSEDYERFGSWSEGIRAHGNHLAAYSGAAPALGSNGEPVHPRYYVVKSSPWAGTVKTIDGLSGKWSTRNDYAKVLRESFLNPLRNA
jgi:Mannosyl-glycoprotein endo-beta-N-acetylglucosaminidase